MTKKEIIAYLNDYYKNLKHSREYENKLAYTNALSLPQLNNLVSKKRELEVAQLFLDKNSDKYLNAQNEIDALDKKIQDFIDEEHINITPTYSCEKCKDTGYVLGKYCSCYIERYLKLLKDSSSLPTKAKGCTLKGNLLSNCEHSNILNKLYEKLNEWLNKFKETKINVCYISGSVGIGKTTLAYSLANDAIKKGYSVYYSTSFNLANLFIDKQFNRLDNLDKYNTAIHSDLLIIDDLGTESLNAPVLEHLFNIIDTRIADNKKIMICTNLQNKMFIEKYGERIFSRITDKSTSLVPKYILGNNLRNN